MLKGEWYSRYACFVSFFILCTAVYSVGGPRHDIRQFVSLAAVLRRLSVPTNGNSRDTGESAW